MVFVTIGILTAIITFTVHGHVQASTLIVPDNYPTIQAAIDVASPGDMIIVRSGVYFENLTLNKPLTLTAESFDSDDPTHNTTIIDGGASNLLPAIFIPSGISPMPAIRGFVIRNGMDGTRIRSEAAIEIQLLPPGGGSIDYQHGSGGVNHHNGYFGSGDDAIDLDDMNHPLTIEDNRILYSADDGIEIRLQDTSAPAQPIEITVRDNELLGCDEDGVQIIDYIQSLDTNRRIVISGNLIANSRFAGIGLMPDANTDRKLFWRGHYRSH